MRESLRRNTTLDTQFNTFGTNHVYRMRGLRADVYNVYKRRVGRRLRNDQRPCESFRLRLVCCLSYCLCVGPSVCRSLCLQSCLFHCIGIKA